MAVRPQAADVRGVRPFDMTDVELGKYIDQAGTSPFKLETASVIPTDAERTAMWALLAAHLATVMREPEPASTGIGPVSVSFSGGATSAEGLQQSAPGREFAARWKNYNDTGAGRILR